MPARSFHRKLVVLLGGIPFIDFLNGIDGVDWWHMQETSGAVALATNSAATIPDTRSVALLTYGDYVAGANWANSSGQIARHSAGSVETFQQDDILAPGKTYQATITLANRGAGSVTITDGGAAISANEQTTRTITSTGTDFIITPTTDFDGDIDVAVILVQQTDILASSDFPGAELYVTANAASDPNGNEADATTGWASNAVILTSDSSIKSAGNFSLKGIFQANGAWMSFDLDTILTRGQIYRLNFDNRHLGSGGNVRVGLGPTSSVPTLYDGLISADTTFINVTINFMHSSDTRYLIAQERNATNDGGVYIDNISITEANPMNGDNTAAAVGQAAGGNLGYGYTFDGATSFVDIYSAELNSKFNPAAHTLIAVCKVANAGVWTDGVFRRIVTLGADFNNRLLFQRSNINGELSLIVAHGGVPQRRDSVDIGSPLGFFMLAVTYDVVADEVKFFANGVKVGSTLTGLGTWVSNLDPTTSVIGAATTGPTYVWNGDITHVGIATRALTAGEINDIWERSGLS